MLKEEIGLYAGSRDLFDYHRHLGQILAQRHAFAQGEGRSQGRGLPCSAERSKSTRRLCKRTARAGSIASFEQSVSRERDTLH